MDSICYNMDRHTANFGIMRNLETGVIVSLAPNYDNNIALIAKGYSKDVTRSNDGLIRFFREFISNCKEAREMYRQMDLPIITEELIDECLSEISMDINEDYVRPFILNGQDHIKEIIDIDEGPSEDEDVYMGLIL